MFLKKNNMLTTSPNPIPIPNPIHPPNPIPNLKPSFVLFSTHLDLNFRPLTEVHRHLHHTTQAIIANLLIFVSLISYWSQTHPSPLTQINLVRKKLTS